MPYFALITSPAVIGSVQHETAQVVGPMSPAQYSQRYGPIDNTVNPPNGFPTRAAAQSAVTRFNSQSASQRETPGSAPFTPNAAKVPGADWLHGINLGGWLLRVGEILLGVVLIGVGVAKLTGTDNFIMKAAGIAGKAAIL
jgi:hypothetical protein